MSRASRRYSSESADVLKKKPQPAVQTYNAQKYIKNDILWSGVCTLIVIAVMVGFYYFLT